MRGVSTLWVPVVLFFFLLDFSGASTNNAKAPNLLKNSIPRHGVKNTHGTPKKEDSLLPIARYSAAELRDHDGSLIAESVAESSKLASASKMAALFILWYGFNAGCEYGHVLFHVFRY